MGKETAERKTYRRMKKLVSSEGYILCKEWEDVTLFERWYRENKITNIGELVYFSCDTMNNQEKILSPDTCFFIPKAIHGALRDKFKSNKEYPQGISYLPSQIKDGTGKYKIYFSCNKLNIAGSVGVCDTLEEAMIVYKEIKEQCIHTLAEIYKDIISNNLYKELKKYEYKE